MHRPRGKVAFVLLALGVPFLACLAIEQHPRDAPKRDIHGHPSALSTASREPPFGPVLVDSKAKLIGFNRALNEHLQHTRDDLRPLQARAGRLQKRFDVFQRTARRTSDPVGSREERHGLLREARRLREAAEQKLQGFEALERRYPNVRRLLRSKPKEAGVPRSWLDRDTERQMELNERIYKNIIDLLVHLIECPVNIIHDMANPSPGPPTPRPSDGASDEAPGEKDEANELYDDREPSDGDGEGPWLEEFHY